ncbi:hypothetical protein LCGC14_0209040 [marine sediment metagenome]|uniref:Uncharacterized protein n=1 Tax=marine sediment metagenome TaxID=412755 RepID=A0A0F9XK18_9ZZZZ
MVTNEELGKAMRWVIRGLTEDKVDTNNVQAVVTWMIENPMPVKEVWLAETEEKDEQDRLAHIEALKAEIVKLEGGLVNV